MDTQKWWKVSSLCLKRTLTVEEVNYFVSLLSEKNYPALMVRKFQRKKYFVAWEITKCHPNLFEGAKMANRFYALNRKMFWHQNKTEESFICGNNSLKVLQETKYRAWCFLTSLKKRLLMVHREGNTPEWTKDSFCRRCFMSRLSSFESMVTRFPP